MYELTESQEDLARIYMIRYPKKELKTLVDLVLNKDTVNKIKYNTLNIEEFPISKDSDKLILQKMINVVENEINNDVGVFGVRKAFFLDANWYYVDPIKNIYFHSKPIYGKTLKELKSKMTKKHHTWLVVDYRKFENTKRRKNISKKKKDNVYTSRYIRNLIKKNSKGIHHKKIVKEEKLKNEKLEELNEELNLNEKNERYRGDRHEFFR